MTKTRISLLLLVVTVSLLVPVSAGAADEQITLAGVRPLTGPFSGGGKEGAQGSWDCVAIANREGGITAKSSST